ncbi:MAG: hypothetical protein ORN53_08560, partial [Crocinitomicaceae bacterium]|nr:hypothetical protein [Crocinitomicaceae bacterium]
IFLFLTFKLSLSKSVINFLLLFLALLVSSLVSIISSGNYKSDFIIGVLKLGVIIFNSYSFAYLAINNFYIDEVKLLKIIVLFVFSIAIISVYIFVNIDAQIWVVNNSNIEVAKSAQYMASRLVDLSIGGGTALSLVFLLGVVCIFELMKKGFYNFGNLLLLLMLTVVTFFSARTGFLFLLFVFVYYLKYFIALIRKNSTKILIFSLLASVIFFQINYAYDLIDYELINVAFDAFVEIFIIDSYSPGAGTTSSILINDHLKLDHNSIEFFLCKNNIEIDSDIAYIKLMYAGGLFSVLIFIFFWCYLFFSSVKNGESKNIVYISFIFFALSVFFTNFKELLFFNARGILFIMLFLYFYIEINKGCKNVY